MILAAETGDWTGRAEGVGLSETKVLDQFQLPIGHWFDQMVDWMDVNAERPALGSALRPDAPIDPDRAVVDEGRGSAV